jgi:hypothetical protein
MKESSVREHSLSQKYGSEYYNEREEGHRGTRKREKNKKEQKLEDENSEAWTMEVRAFDNTKKRKDNKHVQSKSRKTQCNIETRKTKN